MTEQRAVRRYEQRVSGSGITGDEFQYIETVPASDYDALSTELAEAKAEIERMRERVAELEPAADCWIAIAKCYRITVMGSAGLGIHGIPKHENGYAHITVNLWTVAGDPPKGATGDEQDKQGRLQLGTFMDIALKNAALIPAKGKEEKRDA